MSEDNTPDWSRLPEDPLGFFGLQHDFDRNSLKRQYGQLIRRFKPEQHPAEFQKIRSAFEALEQWLRYRVLDGPPVQQNGWTTIHVNQITASADTVADPVDVRLQREPPEVLYRELSACQQKTAADYVTLAILSDVVPSESDGRFAAWVLEGLDSTPTSNSLRSLLHFYLQGPVPSDSLPKLLTQSARFLPEQYFYPLTEHHWIDLLRIHGFESFRESLSQCERSQPGVEIKNRVIFYLQILRHAIWQADASWFQQAITLVEENFRYIPSNLEGEIDLLLELQKYAAVRAPFIARHPLRVEMDAIIRAYFSVGEVQGDELLRAFQMKLLNEPNVLGEAFPDSEEPTLGQFYSLWSWISLDAANRNVGEIFRTPIDPAWNEAGRKLTRRAQHLANWSSFGLKWQLNKLVLILFTVVGFFAIPMLITFLVMMICLAILPPSHDLDVVMVFSSVGSIVGGLALAFRFWAFAKRRWIDPIDEASWPTCYRRLWQPEVLQFLKLTMLPVEDMMRLITTTSFLTVRDKLNGFIERDYALAFYSLAQRFIA